MPAPTALYAIPHLLEWRVSRYMTQSQLADKSGISRTAIATIEGGGKAKPGTVEKLAAALSISIDQLLHSQPKKK